MSSQPSIDEKKHELKDHIQRSLEDSYKKYSRNNRMDIVLTLIGITFSTTVTILAFWEDATLAGILGAISASVLTIQEVFSFNEKANYYRRLNMQTKELRDKLTYKVSSEDELQDIVDSFIGLRNDRIISNPRRKKPD
ncbi:MAG: hypothetical protein AAF327_26020 [Cyanobacteria bacterium P01_A01_bin.37]